MTPPWDDVIARARGLTTHLLDPGRLAALAHEEDLLSLAKALEREGFRVGVETTPVSARGLEAAIRRRAAGRLRLLARWCGKRTALLAVLFEDEDHRSLALLARGAVEGTASGARLQGLLPTPSLPERALNELAALPHPAAMGALLATWNHPYAAPLLAVSREGPVDLLGLECGLDRRFAERATEAARAGDRVLRQYVATVIDLENLWTVLAAAGDPGIKTGEVFLPGGSRLTRTLFERAIAEQDRARAQSILASALKGGPLVAPLQGGGGPGSPEENCLRAILEDVESQRRLEPLSTAAIIAYALGVRLETMALQRIVWGLALGAPSALRFAERAGTR